MFNHFPRLLRATLSALLCWTAACQPPLDSGTEPPETLGAVGTTREIQTARIPRITAVSPPLASNLGGTSLTITGTSFQPGVQVFIGGQPATYTYAMSSTQILASSVSAPTATGPVAVKVVNPDGRQSERSDVLTLFNDNLSLVALRSAISLSGMQLAAVADFNGDGKQDLVLTDSSRVRTLFGRSRGDFSEGPTITLPLAMSVLADVGDFNGDGKPDLIVSQGFWPSEVDVYPNLGSGTFGSPLATAIGGLYGFFGDYIGDVNNDGRSDLVVAGQNTMGQFTVQSFLAGSDGRLAAPVISLISQSLGSGQLRDVNGDGKLDLVTAAPGTSTVVWLAGKGDGSFAAPVASTVGAAVNKLLLADFNGDGKLDLAALGADGNVALRSGNGTGSFSGTGSLTGNPSARSIARGDVNGDGKLDLLVGWDRVYSGMGPYVPGGVSLFAGNGDGSFQTARALSVAPLPGSGELRLGDFDSDGRTDLLVTSYSDSTLAVLYGRSGGGFLEDAQLPSAPTALASADLNGDGKADWVAVSVSANKLYVLLGNGDGTSGAARAYDTDRGPSAVALAEITGDGKTDLLISNYDAATVSLLPGNGDGSFQPQRVFNVGSGANALTTVDLNGDGRLDVITANYEASTVSVLINAGGGSFNPAKSYATGAGPAALAAGDFNVDGRPDVVTANADGSTVSYLQGSAASPGVLNSARSLTTGKGPSAILARDINGDGKLDILTGNADSGDISLLSGKGDGTFNAPSTLAQVGHVAELLFTDLTGDGKADLVISGGSPARVTVLYGFAAGIFSPWARGLSVGGPLAAADLNGDGRADLLVGQQSGAVLLHLNNTK